MIGREFSFPFQDNKDNKTITHANLGLVSGIML